MRQLTMRFPSRCLFLAACIWLAFDGRPRAGEYETLAVVSGSSVDALSADVGFLGTLIQNPRLAENAGKALARQSRMENLAGLDGSRRWGLALLTDGIDIAPLLLLPVTDAQMLLGTFRPLLGEAEPAADGLWKIGRGSWTGYVRERGGWAYVAQSPERLAELPDAAAILAETRDNDWLSLTLHVRRLPEAYRTMAIDNLRATLRAAADRPGKAAAAARLFDADLSTHALRLIEQALAEGEQIRLALALDQESRRLTLEVRFRPLADSPLAATLQQWHSPPPDWADLPADEALRLKIDVSPSAATRGSLVDLIEHQRRAVQPPAGEEDRTPAKDRSVLVGWWLDLSAAALRPERTRLEMKLGGDRLLTWVARCGVADEKAAQGLVDLLGQLAEAQPGAKIARLPFSEADLPAAVARLLGPSPALFAAARGADVLLAAGPEAKEAVSQPAEAMPADGVPLAGVIRTAVAARLLSQLAQDDQTRSIAGIAALNLRSADDRLSLVVHKDGGDLVVQITAHEGILRTAAMGIGIGVLQAMSAPPR